ncbi:hypothetical protein DFQ03_2862 [Maribacter caenipelagi]|uniref:Uncharacterized protein n=1 Tax=Maribacter caenipelagi TaxID=1447781 RepID=A0A4R7CYA4_9FLAO|nr:hypothetical protein DFQ03_2862 [Maribacter caenipelagi]
MGKEVVCNEKFEIKKQQRHGALAAWDNSLINQPIS